MPYSLFKKRGNRPNFKAERIPAHGLFFETAGMNWAFRLLLELYFLGHSYWGNDRLKLKRGKT